MTEPTREQPAVEPELTTRSPWHISRIPGHLGRARTSTVVLGTLFVAVFALYLYIRPDTAATATSGAGNQVPASTTAPAQRTTARTTTPARTQDRPTSTSTDTSTPTPTDIPTDVTTPSATPSGTSGTSGLPTSVAPTSAVPPPSG